MPTNYPTSLDNFTNPTANDSLNLPSHSTQHANANDAIEAIEAKLGVGNADKVGWYHISSSSVTAASTVAFDNVFTSNYENYAIVFSGRSVSASGTSTQLRAKFRTGGVANSNSNYAYVVTQATSANTGPTNRAWSTGAAEIELVDMDSAANRNNGITLHVYSPQITQYTRWDFLSSVASSGSTVIGYQISGGAFTNTTVFDGIQFNLTSGTITGVFSVYGLRNA